MAYLSPWTPDLTGHIFGSWTVLRFNGYRHVPTRHAYWWCRCTCGGEGEVRGTKLKRGLSTQCKACALAAARKAGGETRRLPPGEAAFNVILDVYERNAAAKGIVFSLSKAAMRALLTGDCHYCGAEPATARRTRGGSEFVYNGIDRLDCSEGYEPGNVVSCCPTCNYAKRKMTPEQFISWARRVVEHQAT